jgi:parallel beta-helix repeat protein
MVLTQTNALSTLRESSVSIDPFKANPLSTNQVAAAITPPASSGPSYYVAPNGNDQNTGTLDKPLKSIQSAVGKIRDGGGGNIILRGGVHTLTTNVWVGESNDGSANSRLVIRPYQNEKVVLDGQNMQNPAISVGGQYVDIFGLEIRNSKMGIIGWGARNLSILKNVIHDTQDTGIASYAPTLFGASNILVEGNTVYRTNLKNSNRGNDGNWGSGITMSRTNGAIVKGNLVYENYGEGITATLSNNVRVANNTVRDNYSVELYFDNATNTVFENNFVYNTGNTNFWRTAFGRPQPASGIRVANENYGSESNPTNNIIVRNNIVSGAQSGFEYANYGRGGGLKNVQVVNNTFYNGSEALMMISPGTHQNVTIANNIFSQTKAKPMSVLPSSLSGLSFSRNLWFGGAAGRAQGTGDVNADPMLVNPGGFNAADYKLRSGSAAIDKGMQRSDVTTDFFGTVRPANRFDIGAVEFV